MVRMRAPYNVYMCSPYPAIGHPPVLALSLCCCTATGRVPVLVSVLMLMMMLLLLFQEDTPSTHSQKYRPFWLAKHTNTV